ncbi:MAG TPA: ATP-binding protein [Acidimicrobiales bacterium]|nr:ATP-binding protein [Acidimicrobiales bacterium]
MPASAGSIELSLPADSRYMRLARLMASGVATTAGLPLEEVEDFRIAVDELCATLIEMGDGEPLRLVFDVADDAVIVRATARMGVDAVIDDERLMLSRQILDVVTDGHELAQDDDRLARFTARKLVRGGGVG